MKRFKIVRNKENAFATYGTMTSEDGTHRWVILQNPFVDKDNDGHRDHNKGRIVAGTYRFIIRRSPQRGYDVPWLCGVPDVDLAWFKDEPTATTSQIHIANLPDELEGCTAIGVALGKVQRKQDVLPLPGIVGSNDAFRAFMAYMDTDKEGEVEIVDDFPSVGFA